MTYHDYRRACFALLATLCVAFILTGRAHAQGPICGFPKCEYEVAINTYCANPSGNPSEPIGCEVIDTQSWGNGFVCMAAYKYANGGQAGFAYGPRCACENEPPIKGAMWVRSDGKSCKGGCLYTPHGPGIRHTDPETQRQVSTLEEEGEWRSDGTNCMNNDDPEGPPPIPACDAQSGNCVEPKPDLPGFCGIIGGAKICVENGNCEGSKPEGYVCIGPPDNTPKPPGPPDGPQTPPRAPEPSVRCEINGQPCQIEIWPPPFDRPPCPTGWTRDASGNCVPDDDDDDEPQRCPDGTRPVNGQCPAPLGNCPDGTRPVNGTCTAPFANCPDGSRPVAGTCPAHDALCGDGTRPVNGQCSATYGPCSNGQQPVNGRCPGIPGTCPNGAQPDAQGMCGTGQCDPLTDPEGCTGNEDGNAGGGGTCQAAPFCSGDLIQCAQLEQIWRTRCAIEGQGDDEDLGEPGEGDYGPNTGAHEVWAADGESAWGQLNTSGWIGGGGQCPSLGAAEFAALGITVSLDQILPCSALRVLAMLILAGAFVQAAYIIGRS